MHSWVNKIGQGDNSLTSDSLRVCKIFITSLKKHTAEQLVLHLKLHLEVDRIDLPCPASRGLHNLQIVFWHVPKYTKARNACM